MHAACVCPQVRLLLERNREDLQRQLAVSEGQLGLMQEHLADARQEVEGLRQRVSLEQGRTSGESNGGLAMQSVFCAGCWQHPDALLHLLRSSAAAGAVAHGPTDASRWFQGD